jgi:hypothetical protein
MSTIPAQTTLKWTLDENNYRTAVQTTNYGILQVKSVTNGKTEMDTTYRTLDYVYASDGTRSVAKVEKPAPSWWEPRESKKTKFTDFMAWYSSLPQGGSVTICPYRYTPSVDKKTEKPLEGTDIDKMYHLCNRFRISEPQYKYRQEALLIIGDVVKKVYCETDWSCDRDKRTNYIRVQGDRKRYTTFAEIGDCLNAKGQPKMTVNYRKRTFSVADLF